MTIKEKYIVRTSWKICESILVHLPWKPTKISPTSRCLEEEISHKMCWIFHEALPIWLPIRCPLKKKNCVCLMKSLRNMPESLETVTLVVWVIEPPFSSEKNSPMTSQLCLNLGIFRTSVSLSYLQEVSRWVIFQRFLRRWSSLLLSGVWCFHLWSQQLYQQFADLLFDVQINARQISSLWCPLNSPSRFLNAGAFLCHLAWK